MPPDRLPRALLDDLGSGLRSVFGTGLVAVYLHGSAVGGGFDEDVSDIDLLVVTEDDLDAAAVARLAAFHSAVVERHPDWNDRLDLVYVGRRTLARFREGGSLGVISPGEPFHVRDGVELWIANFYLVRQHARTLLGPDPRETVPPISWGEFLAEVRRYADEVRARDLRGATAGDRAYSVLTVCRALATIASDRPCSKQHAAELVRSWMPEWAWLVDEAERCRLARGRVGLADEATIQAAASFIGLVTGRIAGGGHGVAAAPRQRPPGEHARAD